MMKREIILAILYLVLVSETSKARQNCSGTSVGLTPLTELGTQQYKGFPGGLYPNGQNIPPAAHDSLGRALAAEIKLRNANGQLDPGSGKIVLLSIGMSNATQEFSVFKAMADTDRVKNPQLVIVDGAQGGQTASIIADPNANFWNVIDQRLASAGVSREQVQVAWVKEANANPTQPFPLHAQQLQSNYEAIARNLKSKYPNIKIAYYSSRTYAGYATSTLNPEPYAYESGFAVKWLIEKQISGDPTLAPTGTNPQAPWLAWGPYLWADGMTPRASDGLVWACTDFGTDGTHPATSGRLKVANLLLNFFKSEPTAMVWFLRPSATTVEAEQHTPPARLELFQNSPNPFNPTTTIRFQIPETGSVTLKVFDMLGREIATLVNQTMNAGRYVATFDATGLAGGLYLYRLQVGDVALTRKLVVLR
jgi:hypothetical protein